MEKGYFGEYGGSFVPPQLENALKQLDDAFEKYKDDPDFNQELDYYLRQYVGRPNPLYYAEKLSKELGGAKIYLKREDLNHTGAHKINNVLGQALLAKRMGVKRVIAETGAGQHGVATATACALFDMDCVIYMGEEDTKRQALNVFRMELLGAKVISVTQGTRTLKDAVDAALGDFAQNYESTFYMLGSAVGPHPFPSVVKHFQAIISREARQQILEAEGKLPDAVMACVGGGSNAIGMFANFIVDSSVNLIGVEPAGLGLETGKHAAPLSAGAPGMVHGFKCYVMADEKGEPLPTHSISAGLDYPGVGPEHSYLKDIGRADYVSITDQESLDAFHRLSRFEGIIPALESAHAVAYALKLAPTMKPDQIIIVNVSGRGDKDVEQIFNLTNQSKY
ncbi:tryptophan synthase, beta subunit [Desulfosporosinus orientis DSM 765]|uniref:Tryptophan synthase beta chain n=1 Tax=Desulfosporosinus orientis (strain ATCC 19365 / DSM 765 / NCIMB 8382 / VKM B-1628 / Singapore I) TaxID=768706 RepID=G7W5L0_DESOD|nr:tryptophan synthase subunit beta [Desulfosporosinus orientis]AET66657.1 tryptophan synthase, beta subunit [Desulfosporosinus orientis DSM 765]